MEKSAGSSVVGNVFQNIARSPNKSANGLVQGGGYIPRRAVKSAARITIHDQDVPFIRFEAGPFLGAIGQFLAVWRESRGAVGGRIVLGQALDPAAGHRHPADVVVRG